METKPKSGIRSLTSTNSYSWPRRFRFKRQIKDQKPRKWFSLSPSRPNLSDAPRPLEYSLSGAKTKSEQANEYHTRSDRHRVASFIICSHASVSLRASPWLFKNKDRAWHSISCWIDWTLGVLVIKVARGASKSSKDRRAAARNGECFIIGCRAWECIASRARVAQV